MREVLAEHDVDIDEAPKARAHARGPRGLPRAPHRAGPGARARGDRRGRRDRHRRRGAAAAALRGPGGPRGHHADGPAQRRRAGRGGHRARRRGRGAPPRRRGHLRHASARARRDHRRARGRRARGSTCATRRRRRSPPCSRSCAPRPVRPRSAVAARRARSTSGASSRSSSTSAWWPPRRRRPGTDRALASGALHDAAEMARHVPVAMVFAPSSGGLSHAKEEDTPEADLEKAIDAYGRLALRVIGGERRLALDGHAQRGERAVAGPAQRCRRGRAPAGCSRASRR